MEYEVCSAMRRAGSRRIIDDAHYLALAEEMRFPLLTADSRLVRAAQAHGADWVGGLE
jgi:predicted nucleic acid-binding protein